MYDNAADAGRYLTGSVVYWRGLPGYVTDARGAGPRGIQVRWAQLPTNGHDSIWINIDDPAFNPMKFKLGYVNCDDKQARFVSRKPARIQTQGLCAANLTIKEDYDEAGRGWTFRNLIREPGGFEMMMGRYPTLDEAKARLFADKTIKSVAFDRDFAVVRHTTLSNLFFLVYKGSQVSFSGDFEFSLPEEFQFLTEVCTPKGCLKKVA